MWKNRISNNQTSYLQSTVTNINVLGCLICNYREHILAEVRWLLTCTLLLQKLLLDYRRNIASYFFSIHRMIRHGYSSQLVVCNITLYPAGIAHRGSIEVASFRLKWVKTKFTPLTKPEVRKLIIFSDRCFGQNNNWRMLNLMSMLGSMGYSTQVEQQFMVSGHSFLPCDRSFATIEKRRQVSVLHTPHDVSKMILEAQPAKPFQVMSRQCEDFRHLPDSVLKRPAGLQITSVRWLKVTGIATENSLLTSHQHATCCSNNKIS